MTPDNEAAGVPFESTDNPSRITATKQGAPVAGKPSPKQRELGEWLITKALIRHDAQTGFPTRPQEAKAPRRTVLRTLRGWSDRERSWKPVSASCYSDTGMNCLIHVPKLPGFRLWMYTTPGPRNRQTNPSPDVRLAIHPEEAFSML